MKSGDSFSTTVPILMRLEKHGAPLFRLQKRVEMLKLSTFCESILTLISVICGPQNPDQTPLVATSRLDMRA